MLYSFLVLGNYFSTDIEKNFLPGRKLFVGNLHDTIYNRTTLGNMPPMVKSIEDIPNLYGSMYIAIRVAAPL
jgi:hypothetical protein